jgi:hypothetical protein
MNRAISVSQGGMDVQLPEGFGYRVNLAKHRLVFDAQLQNPKFVKPLNLSVRTTVKYMDDESARKAGLIELRSVRFTLPGMDMDMSHDSSWVHHHGGQFSVPPGKREFSQIFRAEDYHFPAKTTVHYMRPHLHAYAKSIALIDETAKKTLWKGTAQTDSKTGSLSHVDIYSSSEGFQIYRSHTYRLVSEYENPNATPVDAMVMLTIYYRRL